MYTVFFWSLRICWGFLAPCGFLVAEGDFSTKFLTKLWLIAAELTALCSCVSQYGWYYSSTFLVTGPCFHFVSTQIATTAWEQRFSRWLEVKAISTVLEGSGWREHQGMSVRSAGCKGEALKHHRSLFLDTQACHLDRQFSVFTLSLVNAHPRWR